jgi:hypothetical protein
MKTGICKFATTCKFHHPLGRKEAAQVDPVKLTLAGYPRREVSGSFLIFSISF